MKYVVRTLILLLTLIGMVPILSAYGQNGAAWSGKRIDGTIITKNELKSILEKHQTWIAKSWVETDQKEGNQLHLQGADLIGVQLNGTDLRKADLNGANLTDANLIGADLREADLRGADLIDADLSAPKFRDLN